MYLGISMVFVLRIPLLFAYHPFLNDSGECKADYENVPLSAIRPQVISHFFDTSVFIRPTMVFMHHRGS